MLRPMLKYGREGSTIRKYDDTALLSMKLNVFKTAGYTKLHKNRNTDVWEELKIDSMLENIQN